MSKNDVYEPIETVSVSPKSDSNRVPPSEDINASSGNSKMAALPDSIVSGKSYISRMSSSSVLISGYTQCSPSDPAVKVTLRLQSYYDGAWHTLASKSGQTSGTRIDLSQAYSVTLGYYYRTTGTHSSADGTTVYSSSSSILVN